MANVIYNFHNTVCSIEIFGAYITLQLDTELFILHVTEANLVEIRNKIISHLQHDAKLHFHCTLEKLLTVLLRKKSPFVVCWLRKMFLQLSIRHINSWLTLIYYCIVKLLVNRRVLVCDHFKDLPFCMM